jgi:N-acylneuraminate cytidylyltransferase
MKTVAFIPARGGSKGIPNKNLLELDGLPLVAHSILQAKKSELVSDVYVSSDSKEILDVSKNFGAKVIERPAEISGDLATTESSILHFLENVTGIDLIVLLQPTSPLREPSDIDNAIKMTISRKYDSLFSAVELGDMFIWHQSKKLKSINYDHKSRKRRQDIKEEYFIENGSIYVFTKNLIQTEKNRLGGKIGKYIMGKNKLLEIDTIEDYFLCKYYLEKKLWKKD